MKLIDSQKKKVTLSITPLIDVLFILIIFFTISSTFLEQPGIKLDLPKASTSQPERIEKWILNISSDGKIFLGAQEFTRDNLGEALSEVMKPLKEKSLIINADSRAQHGLIVEVMDIARQSGVAKLVISADPEKPGQQ